MSLPPPWAELPSRGSEGNAGEPENLLIHGDNLPALEALAGPLGGRVRCVYIDPPYNTGAGVSHYDDGLAHEDWLAMMRARLLALRPLLASDGVILVSIDDAEVAYLRILLDEVMGRGNFLGTLVWERKRKPSFLDGHLAVVTEYVLAYALDRSRAPAFVGGTTTAGKMHPLNNAGNPRSILRFPAGSVAFGCPDGHYAPADMSAGRIVTCLLDPVDVVGGRNRAAFRLDGEWRYSQARLDAVVAEGGELVIRRLPFRPNHVKPGGKPKKLTNLLSRAHGGVATYEDATAESRALFGDRGAFDYPKPEGLMQVLIGAVTRPGDWVLDAFAGSGTTGAVAQKMGRRWVMIEEGEHCLTHLLPRMRQVVDGSDQGGISEALGWAGGGLGWRFYRGG